MLLGFDAMQIHTLRENHNAYLFSIATNQMQSIIERLHAFSHRVELSNQIAKWNIENSESLPEGRGVISGHFPTYTVTLFWGKSTLQQECQEIEMGTSGCLTEKILL